MSESISNLVAGLSNQFRASSGVTANNTLLSRLTVKDIKKSKRIGVGGFGDVLLVSHPLTGQVALKRLRLSGGRKDAEDQRRVRVKTPTYGGIPNDLLQRALREGEIWRNLRHPNVLPCLGVLEAIGNLFLVSPYMRNGTIQQYLAENQEADRHELVCLSRSLLCFGHSDVRHPR